MNKNEQRRLALSARRGMTEEQRRAASERICERLLALPEVRQAKVILSYVALPDEVDLSRLHEHITPGPRLCFPVSLPGGVMEAWEPGDWKRGPYGIWEPDRTVSTKVEPGEIDLVLAPCVGFDEERRRLGHGAGYYDRFLPRCPGTVIAVAFEAQMLPRVVTEAHDRAMDAVVTEARVY